MPDYTDYSGAATSNLIPARTEAPIRIAVQAGDADVEDGHGCLKRGSKGDSLMLNLECTITDGPFAKRKFFHGLYMGPERSKPTEGQQTGIDMSREKIRAIAEAARGFAPSDESPAAIASRKLKTLRDLDGMEVTVIIGVEEGEGSYDDRNNIKRVVAVGKAKPVDGSLPLKGAPAATAAKPRPQQQQSW
jgi:hypothetical protein